MYTKFQLGISAVGRPLCIPRHKWGDNIKITLQWI